MSKEEYSEEKYITPEFIEYKLLNDIDKALNLEKYEKAKQLSEIYKNIKVGDIE